ncbi:hypothetical protein L1887_39568 [Cichorium endivia]|nr:hypothetical protein L1887_39568 [Cichorium endivia]
MANSGKAISDSLKSLTYDAGNTNKPDYRELEFGSPDSHLRPRPEISSSSSSSGSVSGRNENGLPFRSASKRADSGGSINNHSGELSVNSSPKASAGRSSAKKSGHTRSYSGGGTGGHSPVNSGGSSATSPAVNALPTGNIFPSGKILKTGMMTSRSPKSDVLSSGARNYGHGSIIGRGSTSKSPPYAGGTEPPLPNIPNSNSSRRLSFAPEELKKVGTEYYKRGNFKEALSYYDRAIAISPENPSYHCYRGAALMILKRLIEAVKEFEEAIKLDSGYMRAHRRLGTLLISLGQVENARKHICFQGNQPNPNELKKLQAVESYIKKCTDCRRVLDWVGVLRECDAAIVCGANSCPQLFACKAEALLKVNRLDDADVSMSNVAKFEASCSLSCAQEKFFGMHPEAYLFFVRAQIDMAFGRFGNAVTSIEKSGQIDTRNVEIALLLQNVRSVCRARARGNDLYKSERFLEACSAYGEGLRYDAMNPVIYCNRAACWFKLGQMERSLDDCNNALLIHPNYTKALLRRAATYSKLDRWVESVRDYEVLRRELPNNNDVAESLFHAQVALKKSRGEEVYNIKFGGEVELITSLEQFKSVVASTGVSVVLFKSSSDMRCKQISTFLDTLCTRYPSIIFLKVDVEESSIIAKSENISIVPTIKIYKKGNRAKEMICPSQEALESSVKHYGS